MRVMLGSINVKRPTISSLWLGGALNYLELLSLKSMQDWGHQVKLYHYQPLENAPKWLDTIDANTIMPASKARLETYAHNPAPFSDLFRYHLLAKTDEIWCDCDAYFLRPLEYSPYLFVDQRGRPNHSYSNSLLRLPQDSPAINELLELFSSDTPTLPEDDRFYDSKAFSKDNLERLGDNGNVHIADMPPGITGSMALTYFITKHNLGKYAQPRQHYFPLPPSTIGILARPKSSTQLTLPAMAQSVNFYSANLRSRLIECDMYIDNEPMQGSFLHTRLQVHGIDPKSAPLLPAKKRKTSKNMSNFTLQPLESKLSWYG